MKLKVNNVVVDIVPNNSYKFIEGMSNKYFKDDSKDEKTVGIYSHFSEDSKDLIDKVHAFFQKDTFVCFEKPENNRWYLYHSVTFSSIPLFDEWPIGRAIAIMGAYYGENSYVEIDEDTKIIRFSLKYKEIGTVDGVEATRSLMYIFAMFILDYLMKL